VLEGDQKRKKKGKDKSPKAADPEPAVPVRQGKPGFEGGDRSRVDPLA
jgi:hypothetical protein